MPPKTAPKRRSATTAVPRKPPAGHAQSARKNCGCHEVPGTLGAKKFEKDRKHSLSKHEPAEASLSCAFTVIKICASLQGHIQQNELLLTTSKAIFDKDKSRKLAEEAKRQQLELTQQQKEEAAREKEVLKQERQAERIRKQAVETVRSKALGFISFNYGRSADDRRAIGNSWAANQLVHTQSVLQTAEDGQRVRSGPTTSEGESPQLLSNRLNTDQRITRQIISQRKIAFGVPSHPFPDQPNFSPLKPSFAHGPTQPLTPANSTFDTRQNSILDPSPDDLEDMSDKQVYPESGGAAKAIKDVIHHLFDLQLQIHQFRPEQQEGVNRQVERVANSLSALDEIVTQPSNPLHNLRVAPEIIEYVDDARNPDIFSREFVELVQRGNSVLNGKQQAFRGFSQIYAKKLKESFEGLDDEVDLVMSNAGMEERNGKYVDKVRSGSAGQTK